uniref:DUF445 domain-containing protein n=1 Tax=Mucochytrium quahogii TaxID=96639 RepID=A0A7S2WEC2_9STRA|mmetsp:Transcript_18578/g.30296  ORF Transcript_18578/g.30296 Transcript_18578/m.30296 type:complete len:587 (+) Transcript_18578:175-1935(+)
MERWSEIEVIGFLIDENLFSAFSLGLKNGVQLCAMTKEDCVAAVDGKISEQLEREKYGMKLFSAIQNAKNSGWDLQKRRSSIASVKSINTVGSTDFGYLSLIDDGFQYHRLEEIIFSSEAAKDDDIDPEAHKFPPLCAYPGGRSIFVSVLVIIVSVLFCTVLKEDLARWTHCQGECDVVKKYFLYASIPVLMVPFTYAHIWVALYMTFYPINFVGCWQIPGTNVGFPFGWQGIVPFKCVEMAQMAVRMLTAKLLTVDEVFDRLDAKQVADILEVDVSRQMTEVVNEIAEKEAPRIWGLLPNSVKEHIFKEAAKESPAVIQGMLKEIQAKVEECFDLEELVVSIMVGDMELSNNMFIQCADRELAFIRNSGAWMGFFFGLIQMVISIYFEDWWVLPVVGLVAGAITNWIALFAIFNPVNPVHIFGYRIQGLFLTRQDTVSALYGKIVAERILTAENLDRALMTGPKSEQTRVIARKHIRQAYEKSIAMLRHKPLSLTVSQETLDRVGDEIANKMSSNMYAVMRPAEPYMDKVFDLRTTLETRMKALPAKDFEGLLHPVFEADEWKLVLCGGVLGVVFGLFQSLVLGR